MGITKTRYSIQRYFTWKHLHADVAEYIKYCPSCQVQKGSTSRPVGLLQPLEVPPYPWHTVNTDYMTGLPKTAAGNDAIVVFVDKLTKYVLLVACSKESSAFDWVSMFLHHVHGHFGLPDKIVSDRGPQFTSAFNHSLADRLGSTWALSTARRPETDSQTERTNHTLQTVLRHFVSPTMHDWDQHLSLMQFAINNSWQETVQETPHFLNFGRHPKTALNVDLPSRQLPVVNPASGELALKMQHLTARVKKCMFAAQQRQKFYYDSGRSDYVYKVGDHLLLSTAGITNSVKVKSVGTEKLLPKWLGPFTCIAREGNLAYKLELPETLRIHDVFHVSLLKPYYDDGRIPPPPPSKMIDDEPEWEVDRILDHRVIKHNKRTKVRYLLRFLGYGPEHDFWQDDVSNCPKSVKKYWDSKPAAARLTVAVCLTRI